MTKELEQRRADAKDQTESYMATIDSLEPDIQFVDPGAFYASAAISLKRIADVADLFALSLLKDHKAKDDNMRDWARRHRFDDLWDKASS